MGPWIKKNPFMSLGPRCLSESVRWKDPSYSHHSYCDGTPTPIWKLVLLSLTGLSRYKSRPKFNKVIHCLIPNWLIKICCYWVYSTCETNPFGRLYVGKWATWWAESWILCNLYTTLGLAMELHLLHRNIQTVASFFKKGLGFVSVFSDLIMADQLLNI